MKTPCILSLKWHTEHLLEDTIQEHPVKTSINFSIPQKKNYNQSKTFEISYIPFPLKINYFLSFLLRQLFPRKLPLQLHFIHRLETKLIRMGIEINA